MLKHVHSYKKVKLKKAFVYRCMKADCSHYILPNLILGKESTCPSCHNDFVIDKYASQRTTPICENCRKNLKPESPTRSPELDTQLAEVMKRLGVQ